MNKLTGITVTHCARCHKNHKDLEFKDFEHPVVDECKEMQTIWTHWAKCPNSGDPILLRVLQEAITT